MFLLGTSTRHDLFYNTQRGMVLILGKIYLLCPLLLPISPLLFPATEMAILFLRSCLDHQTLAEEISAFTI